MGSISNYLFQKELIFSITEIQGVGPAFSPKYFENEALFIAAMTFYLTTLYDAVMDSWKQFAETQREIAREKDKENRFRKVRQAELAGQRRQIEMLNMDRQAARFQIYEGPLFGNGFDHRHLHAAI